MKMGIYNGFGGSTKVEVTPERKAKHDAVYAVRHDRAKLAALIGSDATQRFLDRMAGGSSVFDALAHVLGWTTRSVHARYAGYIDTAHDRFLDRD